MASVLLGDKKMTLTTNTPTSLFFSLVTFASPAALTKQSQGSNYSMGNFLHGTFPTQR